jgi:hypothetical protein
MLNVLSYYFLKKRESPTALMVWAWEYALLMQIPEGIAWLQIENGQNIQIVSRIAMILNVTQPVALFVGIRLGGLCGTLKYGHIVLFMYGLVLVTQFDHVWEGSLSIAPNEGCTHLNLGYWDTSRGIVYVASSLLIISEVPILFWTVVHSMLFLVSLTFAIVLYPCGVGSVWCWFIFVSGPILLVADVIRCQLVSPTLPPTSVPYLTGQRRSLPSSWLPYRSSI